MIDLLRVTVVIISILAAIAFVLVFVKIWQLRNRHSTSVAQAEPEPVVAVEPEEEPAAAQPQAPGPLKEKVGGTVLCVSCLDAFAQGHVIDICDDCIGILGEWTYLGSTKVHIICRDLRTEGRHSWICPYDRPTLVGQRSPFQRRR